MKPRTLKCLIADDEELLRLAVVSTLEQQGFTEIETAKNGKEALEKLSASKFDLLITDNNMPFLDGIDVIRKIKTKQPELKVILVSGRMLEIQNEAESLDVHCLAKPYRINELKSIIDQVISKPTFVST